MCGRREEERREKERKDKGREEMKRSEMKHRGRGENTSNAHIISLNNKRKKPYLGVLTLLFSPPLTTRH